ncbi:uncharacterized protein LOC6586849 isoform X2 [Drosophila mojavensis]|uniref:uncharacterized protein LOC6586849 isoform X2 n=1 Tax=Drosophila mojavensis TaxID=7230 RepID=UPI001CD13204|nr:uncharacterized protein LOC6586849 isoform X2 [Drosophila mojavensis]
MFNCRAARKTNLGRMRNDSEGIDVGTSTEVDERSDPEGVHSEGDDASVLPSGSRTLDKRLNPEAPDFVPGVRNGLLAAKIVEDLANYTRWSNAAGEDVSYGPRYDGIWSESCLQAKALAGAQPSIVESVGDRKDPQQPQPQPQPQQQQPQPQPQLKKPSLKKRSKIRCQFELEPGSDTAPTGRCCACEIM